ncbi:hypothetical protein BC826DRAFT_341901 [Russula brevipes]|nr:hypothetical protein BC826DRAFT_341901 [Russula brevipes]
MVIPHDPSVVMDTDSPALVKVWHVMDGIFLWEFFTTLGYEWSVIWGRRPYRWTIWVCSDGRLLSCAHGWSDERNTQSCRLGRYDPNQLSASGIFELFFCYTSAAAASLMIVLRIIAIWDRNMFAMTPHTVYWESKSHPSSRVLHGPC